MKRGEGNGDQEGEQFHFSKCSACLWFKQQLTDCYYATPHKRNNYALVFICFEEIMKLTVQY